MTTRHSQPDTPVACPFPRLDPSAVHRAARRPVDDDTLGVAAAIIRDVRARGLQAVLDHAHRLGDLAPGDRLVYDAPALRASLDAVPPADRRVLETAAARIASFAASQRACLRDLETTVDGMVVGHTVAPVERAGCYAPGGRFPLPSSVLMTACTARAAGVRQVWVASPKPQPITLAAASLAGADALIAVGGAHAVAALAYGAGPIPACDTIAGPGNRWVTAAKKLVYGDASIDMLAGPSEVLIIADDSADPAIVAADLLAQAEHDTDAACWLVTTSPALVDHVERELVRQLESLPSAAIARVSLANGGSILCASLDQAVALSDRLAPEHLEIMTREAGALAGRCSHYGAVFIGTGAAEVIGDYGIGPNHTLPTGGAGRFSGGLSVFNFLRIRTFIRSVGPAEPGIYSQTAAFARLEGLEAHARAAERRIGRPSR